MQHTSAGPEDDIALKMAPFELIVIIHLEEPAGGSYMVET